ncbi:MAG: hypothetical protein WC135_08160 [Bacteroidales bacterium]
MTIELFNKLKQIDLLASNKSESWVHIMFEGKSNKSTCNKPFMDLFAELEKNSLEESASFYIDKTTKCSFKIFIEDLVPDTEWKLHINKTVFFKENTNGFSSTFFYEKKNLIEWINKSNPFSEDYPLNKIKCKIIVKDLSNSFAGANFMVVKEINNFPTSDWKNFNSSLIVNNVHIISKSKFLINPINHHIENGEIDDVSKYFYRNSILVLLTCLCNEVYENGKIILKGYRRIELDLGLDYMGTEVSTKYQKLLVDALLWVYDDSEKCDLRLKLLLERITLDIDYKLPYIQSLYTIIENATIQAKERYSFIIYDRKDLYQKELKDLLKDIKKLTDNYSSKIRNVLKNLLRDILAAFLLIGITLFSKVTEIEQLFDNKMIKYVFSAFGIYFILSAILQFIIDLFDYCRSVSEFNHWKKVTQEYMSTEDFERHKKDTLKWRSIGSIIIYNTIITLYIIIGICCLNMSTIWDTVMKLK